MANSVNKVILIGNLGKDPKINTSKSGKKWATLSIATSKRSRDKDSGEYHEKTNWHNIVVFNNDLAEMLEAKAKKGGKVYVEGELETRSYHDPKIDDARWVTEVVVSGFNGTTIQVITSDDIGQGAGRGHAPDPAGPDDYGNKAKPKGRGARQPAQAHDDDVPF
jgi:single-strand DNA-binding protein